MTPQSLNLPNQLTCLRIFLTILFMVLLFLPGALFKGLALILFLLASLTDYWDGRIARERNQITNFGKLMDPIADKLLTLSAFMAFVQMDIFPAWMVVVIIARDLLITGLRLVLPQDQDVQAVRSSGKHKTALQFASIVGILIFLVVRETPLWNPEWTSHAISFIYLSMLFIVGITLWSGVRIVTKNWDAFL